MKSDLFLSILSMDTYNRGYNPGMAGLDENGSVGSAVVLTRDGLGVTPTDYESWQAASFYAVAYKLDQAVDTIASGTTIISYRGTDDLQQELGPVDFGISYFQSFQQQQILMAAQFYNSVNSRSHPQT